MNSPHKATQRKGTEYSSLLNNKPHERQYCQSREATTGNCRFLWVSSSQTLANAAAPSREASGSLFASILVLLCCVLSKISSVRFHMADRPQHGKLKLNLPVVANELTQVGKRTRHYKRKVEQRCYLLCCWDERQCSMKTFDLFCLTTNVGVSN